MNKSVKSALSIGLLCSFSYLAVYFARNILSTVSPQMIADGIYTTEQIGSISSVFFIFYAVGQLINGYIGDRIKARYMISFGLFLAGVTNIVFSLISGSPIAATFIYGMTGFFLSMIYGPMTKVVAENTEPIYAPRCSLGFTFASFFGSPIAGLVASILAWHGVFIVGSAALFVMAGFCFVFFLIFEKKGIVKYGQYKRETAGRGSIRLLIKYRIIKFSLISILTGIVRTAVVFWLPTYISQYLGFHARQATAIFTAATLFVSTTSFISVFVYERLNRNMDLTILIMFSLSAIFFFAVYLVKQPVLNIIFIIIAVMSSCGAASMLWTRYCSSLRDTGMVSGVTGFLDFLSYMAASASSVIFANAVTNIGWRKIILIWTALMLVGVIVSLPYQIIRDKLRGITSKEN